MKLSDRIKRLSQGYQGMDDQQAIVADVEKLEAENRSLTATIAELKARKCSHGDYRMQGTTDCKNSDKCDGRTEYYVIGDGLCLSCRHREERQALAEYRGGEREK